MRIEKEKGPCRCTSTGRGSGKRFADHVSHKEFTTSEGKVLHIFDLLNSGAENGTTLQELVKLTGQDERIVRRRIQAERKAGKLILSDCLHGYFLPASEQEARRFIRSMSGRAAEIAAVSRAAEAALADMAGQEQIAGWNDG